MTTVRGPGVIRVIDGGTHSCSHWITPHQVGLQNNTPELSQLMLDNSVTAANSNKKLEDDGGHLINVTITRPTSQQQLVNSTELVPSTEISKAKSESLTVEDVFYLLLTSFGSGEDCPGPFQTIKSRFYKLESSVQPQLPGCRRQWVSYAGV